MTAIVDKENIKKILKDLVTKEPDFLSELLLEIDAELKQSKRKRLEEFVKNDFDEYGEVFKALA